MADRHAASMHLARFRDRARLLGVFAHPDDEVFCAGGTFAKYAAAGAEAMVLSATRGQAGQIRDASAATRRTLGEVRERELRRSCECLGVGHVVVLDHMDGTLASLDRERARHRGRRLVARLPPGRRDHLRPGRRLRAPRPRHDERDGHGRVPPGGEHRPPVASATAPGDQPVPQPLPEPPHAAGRSTWRSGSLVRRTGSAARASSSRPCRCSPGRRRRCTTPATSSTSSGSRPVPTSSNRASCRRACTSSSRATAEVRQEQPDGSIGRPPSPRARRVLRRGRASPAARARTAHVVARDSVTCLVLSWRQATAFDGRGDDAGPAAVVRRSWVRGEAMNDGATTCIDVRAHVPAKVAAIAAYRTQYPIRPDMFPVGDARGHVRTRVLRADSPAAGARVRAARRLVLRG